MENKAKDNDWKRGRVAYIDPYTSELFENFTGVNDACTFSELIELAEDFITTIGNDFQGISIDYEAKDYALQYVRKNHLQSHLAS